MLKFLLAIVTGLVGAAVLHILLILILPFNSNVDAWSKVEDLGEPFEFFTLKNEPNESGLYNEDIFIQSAVCHYILDEGPLQIIADETTEMWTLAAFDAGSNEIFSMSARSAINGEVNFILGTKGQLLNLRSEEPELIAETIAIEVADIEGYVALRSIVPSISSLAEAQGFLSNALCARL